MFSLYFQVNFLSPAVSKCVCSVPQEPVLLKADQEKCFPWAHSLLGVMGKEAGYISQ